MGRKRRYKYEEFTDRLTGADTFAARLKTAMTARGLKSPVDLSYLLWDSNKGRYTTELWMTGKRSKLTPELAYLVADKLEVNARWLILGPPNTPERPIYLTPDEVGLLDVYRALGPEMGHQWLLNGKALAKLAGKILKSIPEDLTPAATLKPMANSNLTR